MSHKADSQTPLRTHAREGGRLRLSRLTYRGILAAKRLARAGHVYIDKKAEGWDLVLVQQEAGS
jgi:hypothetical protein